MLANEADRRSTNTHPAQTELSELVLSPLSVPSSYPASSRVRRTHGAAGGRQTAEKVKRARIRPSRRIEGDLDRYDSASWDGPALTSSSATLALYRLASGEGKERNGTKKRGQGHTGLSATRKQNYRRRIPACDTERSSQLFMK